MSQEQNNLPTIFISYSSHYRYIAAKIYEYLKKEKYDVFWDEKLKTSDDWKDVLVEEITNRDVFLYLLTPESLHSLYCNEEFNLAAQEEKYFIGISLRVDVERILPEKLRGLQFITFYDGFIESKEKNLLETLQRYQETNPLDSSRKFTLFEIGYRLSDVVNEVASFLRKIYAVFKSPHFAERKKRENQILEYQGQINNLIETFRTGTDETLIDDLYSHVQHVGNVALRESLSEEDMKEVRTSIGDAFKILSRIAWK